MERTIQSKKRKIKEASLARQRIYDRRRYTAMAIPKKKMTEEQSTQQPLLDVPSFDDPSIASKVIEFHNNLVSLIPVKCSVYLELLHM